MHKLITITDNSTNQINKMAIQWPLKDLSELRTAVRFLLENGETGNDNVLKDEIPEQELEGHVNNLYLHSVCNYSRLNKSITLETFYPAAATFVFEEVNLNKPLYRKIADTFYIDEPVVSSKFTGNWYDFKNTVMSCAAMFNSFFLKEEHSESVNHTTVADAIISDYGLSGMAIITLGLLSGSVLERYNGKFSLQIDVQPSTDMEYIFVTQTLARLTSQIFSNPEKVNDINTVIDVIAERMSSIEYWKQTIDVFPYDDIYDVEKCHVFANTIIDTIQGK